jgi:hypothetical protein
MEDSAVRITGEVRAWNSLQVRIERYECHANVPDGIGAEGGPLGRNIGSLLGNGLWAV